MEDYLVKAICFDGKVRAYAVRATNTVAEAQRRHDTWSASSAALGRTIVAGLILGATVKGDDIITAKVQGDGPAGSIVVTANGSGQVKGYIQQPHVSLPLNEQGKIDVRGAVGTEGVLTVIKDLGLKEPFSGQVPLVSGELGEDFTYYMATSEQVPSSIGLSVLVNPDESIKASGGFMIQMMPGADEEIIEQIEERLQQMPLVSDLLDQGESPEQILARILGEEHLKIIEKEPVSFHCDCSKEKFARAIISVGKEAIEEMINEDHGAEAVCQFCENKYQYTEEELQVLLEEALN